MKLLLFRGKFAEVVGRRCVVWAILWLFFLASAAQAQPLAFPGALGFGANATGGRGGTVYHVTTLADSGAGSFRDAVSHSGRIVIFDVGGYINLQTAVSASSSLTIAGQTAPGGIGIMGAEVSFTDQTNVIVRNMRFRQGDIHDGSNPNNTGESAINLGGASSTDPAGNVIFDHVSVEFGYFDSVDAVNTANFTFQNSIIADPIGQQFGAHHEGSNASWIRNLWVNAHNRQPLAKADTVYINNVIYNFQAGYTCGDTGGSFSHDIVNNYFIAGPSTTSPNDDFFQLDANQSTYGVGNLLDGSANGVLSGSATDPNQGGPVLTSPWSPITATIPTFSTTAAFRYAVSACGAFPRDQVDTLVLGNVTSLGTTGAIIGSETDTGLANNGYGVIDGGAPALDSDGDGMPDYWENAMGLNPNVNDAMTIAADGYANIEHYINWLADPHALTISNTAVDIDLHQYTSGFTNVSPVYAVSGASNGVVTLTSGHIAHFVPASAFVGMGGFQFSVNASDDTGYTNAVDVLVTPPTPQPQNLTWVGDGIANDWTVGGVTNWFDGTNLVAFSTGDNATFDDTGSDTPVINLSGSIAAGTVFVVAAQDYTFSGNGFLAGPTALFKTGAGQLTLDTTNTFTGGTTINEGVVQVGDGVSANGGLSGNVTNNDTLVFATPGTATSSINISGGGSLTKNGAGALTLNGTFTYTGQTTVNAGTLTFTNTIPPSDISNATTLILGPTVNENYTNTISGPGSVTVNAGATLILSGTNTFTGGLTNAGGILILSNNNPVATATISYTGSGTIAVAGGTVITNNFSIPGTATIDLSMRATNGTGVWAGNVVNLGSAASWRPGADTGGTLMFTGTAAQGSRNFIVPRGSVQFASNAVVSATGGATALGRDTSNGNRSANVTIRDNATMTLGACSFGGGQQGGSVTVTVQNNAAFSTGVNPLDLHNINRSTAVSTLRLNGGTTIVSGFTKTQSTFTNFIDFNGGLLRAIMPNAGFLPLTNAETVLVQAGGAIIDDGGFQITIGQPLVHDSALGATPDGGLTKLGAGTLTLTGTNIYTGTTVISNGTLAVSGNGSITTSPVVNLASGNLTVPGGFPFSGARKLSGFGSVSGNFTLGGGASLTPGPLTPIRFNGSLTLSAGSATTLEVSHSPLTNGSLIVLGVLTRGGALVVTNVGATALAAGDAFALINVSAVTGGFSTVVLPPLGTGLAWNTNALNTTGVLTVFSTNPPVINAVSAGAGQITFTGVGGTPRADFFVLASTNVSLPSSNWTIISTNFFDTLGNFAVTNTINPGQPQEFFLIEVP